MFWFSLPFLCALCVLCGENLLTYSFKAVKYLVHFSLDYFRKKLIPQDPVIGDTSIFICYCSIENACGVLPHDDFETEGDMA